MQMRQGNNSLDLIKQNNLEGKIGGEANPKDVRDEKVGGQLVDGFKLKDSQQNG